MFCFSFYILVRTVKASLLKLIYCHLSIVVPLRYLEKDYASAVVAYQEAIRIYPG